ncbi:MAG TPA: hypothetical protein VEJ47_11310, partial [Candidatus Eremiobacteraceae bacterium]|nr:hypothetical protein [Candidatus Eremiobacteraceae bacterium]
MSSKLLAESLGRDPNLQIIGTAAASEILPLALHKPDVALISKEFDTAADKGLRVARTLHSSHPQIHIVMLLEVSTRES